MSYAISDSEFKARIAAFNREQRGEKPIGDELKVVRHPSAGVHWLDMSSWDGQPLPERLWSIKDRVPLNQAGLFSGEGGTGKSIIELMKDVAHVAGKEWLGSLPVIGPAFYIGAEDDENEIHIRLAAIASHYETTFQALIDGGFHVQCLLGTDATLCAETRGGQSRGHKPLQASL